MLILINYSSSSSSNNNDSNSSAPCFHVAGSYDVFFSGHPRLTKRRGAITIIVIATTTATTINH